MGRSAKRVKRHHGLKVSRKPKGLPKLAFKDKTLRAKWDAKKTLQANFKASGLNVNPNSMVEEEDTMDFALVVPQEAEKVERLSEGQIQFAEKCIAKYGEDYAKMSRDAKINVMQMTPAQIRRSIEKYRKLVLGEEK